MTRDREGDGAAPSAPPPAAVAVPRQREALAREVDAIGKAWAESYIDALLRDGRPITGGWPGTMSEARARVSGCARRSSSAELDHHALARRAYVAARARWLSRSASDPDH